ncbi:MAG TPA: glycosyltransferase [Accumulibacter sp.]|nr:glycosyltransferase [Accumulibacter sp.]HRE69596.1 glycosyltransferase [Accumulibacter sp.]
MKIAIVSHSDLAGGAARAATRLHRGLLASGLDSRMHVTQKQSNAASVIAPITRLGRAWNLLRPALGHVIVGLQKSEDRSWRSLGLLPTLADRRILAEEPDVVNLHWIGDETLNIGEVARLARCSPVVWTLHDMWPFCGAEHYADEHPDARWRHGYPRSSRPTTQTGIDLDRWTWRRKAAAWRDIPPIHLIAPSRWIADRAAQSPLMRGWPTSVIPNALDVHRFRPTPRSAARQALGLPLEGPVLLFGSLGSNEAKRKGWDLLAQALATLAITNRDLSCLIVGQEPPANPPSLSLPTRWLGTLHDDISLALVYAAVDVTVVPSRQEVLGQLATEAQACGCPVAAFHTGGLSDVVDHLSTGYLAQPFDPSELAQGIRWILDDPERHMQLRIAARRRARQLWSPDVVIPRYEGAFRQAIADFSRAGR